jgi:hypothetical protein
MGKPLAVGNAGTIVTAPVKYSMGPGEALCDPEREIVCPGESDAEAFAKARPAARQKRTAESAWFMVIEQLNSL